MPSLSYSDRDHSTIHGKVSAEVGFDVVGLQPRGKLLLLQEWLYGRPQTSRAIGTPNPLAQIVFRLAPSIITRSELELLGISTPRFAYRAYLTEHSFTNLRRLKVIQEEISTTHTDEELKKRLLEGMSNSYSWMADSLLEKPERLKDHTVLTCQLAADYSEDPNAALTPFVTNVHVLVGGGQCAQAAVFMALCLSPARKIVGIAEITKLCAESQSGFPIEGLPFHQIVKFFERKCPGVNGLASITVGLERELDLQLSENALYSYCINKSPVIVLTSIARMWGTHLPLNQRWRADHRSLLRFSDHINHEDFNALPLGVRPQRLNRDHPVTVGTKAKDHHAVVLVGVSNQHNVVDGPHAPGRRTFVFNDPATFPFIACTLDQLYAARAYIQEKSKSADDQERVVTEKDLAPLTTLAVVPENVLASLLNTQVGEKKDELGATQNRQGLLSMLHTVLTGPGLENLKYSKSESPACQYPVHLLKVSKLDDHLQWQFYSGWDYVRPETRVTDRLGESHPLHSKVPVGMYWVHHIPHPDLDNRWSESIWFWPADVKFISSRNLKGYIVRDLNSDTFRLLREFDR